MRSATDAIAESVKRATVACDAASPNKWGEVRSLVVVDAPGPDRDDWKLGAGRDKVNFLGELQS